MVGILEPISHIAMLRQVLQNDKGCGQSDSATRLKDALGVHTAGFVMVGNDVNSRDPNIGEFLCLRRSELASASNVGSTGDGRFLRP